MLQALERDLILLVSLLLPCPSSDLTAGGNESDEGEAGGGGSGRARDCRRAMTTGMETSGSTARPAVRRSALEMIADCFRHQHPEAFGLSPVTGPLLPTELRGAREEALSPGPMEFFAEEAMGHPEAVRLRNRAAGAEWSGDFR